MTLLIGCVVGFMLDAVAGYVLALSWLERRTPRAWQRAPGRHNLSVMPGDFRCPACVHNQTRRRPLPHQPHHEIERW